MSVELKKAISALDLSFAAARKRQSPRTGWIHLSYADLFASDTIPLYENVCFALTLCGQRKAETILEAKDLLSRIFPFQAEEGNFPIYLHEYPRCYDPHVGLKIAPLFVRLIREFGSVLGADCKQKLEQSIQRILAFSAKKRVEKPFAPLWELRYQALCGNALPTIDTTTFSAEDWWHYWISVQFTETPVCAHFHSGLCSYIGPAIGDTQYYYEPTPHLLEWMAAQTLGCFTPRLLKDHPHQIKLAALSSLKVDGPFSESSYHIQYEHLAKFDSRSSSAFRVLWNGETLHSLVLPKSRSEIIAHSSTDYTITLPVDFDQTKDDYFETVLYCDLSPETQLFINGQRGTVFTWDDTVEIRSGSLSIDLSFKVTEGEGQFCGHLHRGNRPTQTANAGPLQHEAFDWRIALRTLRRSPSCKLHLRLAVSEIS